LRFSLWGSQFSVWFWNYLLRVNVSDNNDVCRRMEYIFGGPKVLFLFLSLFHLNNFVKEAARPVVQSKPMQ